MITAPDRERGRGRRLLPSPVKALANQHGLAVYQPTSMRGEEVLQQLATPLPPDLIIVVAYGLLIPPAILELPRHGCINVHLSLLPHWRGASPINQVILHGDPETGVTIMQMDQGLDTGPILAQRSYQLTGTETTAQLTDKLADLGSTTLLATLDDILAGQINAAAQDSNLATYAKKITKSDGLVDWTLPAITIERQIRGYNPWPVCYAFLNGKRLRIWQAEAVAATKTENNLGEPGTITAATKQGLEVQTGSGKLRIQTAQWDSAKQLPIASLLNASNNPLQIGQCFGAAAIPPDASSTTRP